jgi:hypothetical protein
MSYSSKTLRIVRPQEVRGYALEHGLQVDDFSDLPASRHVLPSVEIVRHAVSSISPRLDLDNPAACSVTFPDAIVRRGNLGVIHGDALLPGGYSHSLNWVERGDMELSADRRGCTIANLTLEPGPNTKLFMLGIASHYGHFFTDCLDRILAFGRYPARDDVECVLDAPFSGQIAEFVKLLGKGVDNRPAFIPEPGRDYRVTNLVVPLQRSLKPAISAQSLVEARARILQNTPVDSPGPRKKIYVGRTRVARRKIVNQPQLEKVLGARGFEAFYPEDHSTVDAIKAFAAADLVVLAIGSSKFNLIFCRPGTRVIILAPEGYAERGGPVAIMARHICSIFSLKLVFCSCDIAGAQMGLDSDFAPDSKDIESAIRIAEAIPG